jgi:AhpD family alkylhydroperoxidase
MVCRETELVGDVPRQTKEAVAAAVSQLNNCSYCVDAHTIMLNAAGDRSTANAISNACYNDIPDPKIRAIVNWALATNTPKSEALRWRPFSRQEAPEIIGTAVYYHYINRMACVFLGDTPLPSSRRWLKGSLKRAASLMFSSAIHRHKKTGDALQFLPKADLPPDLHWAKMAPNVAQAYARFAATAHEIGEHALPTVVRETVQQEISEWDGETSELDLAWIEDAISRYDEATQAAARLAMLTALAPNKINGATVQTFRKHFPEDEKLVGALSWASFAAARKIGTWLQSQPAGAARIQHS